MKTALLLLFTLSNILCIVSLKAQNKPISKLDKISITDFNPVSPVVDSNANAVVLADIGSTEFEGNNNGDFTLVFKHTRRILLKNKNAFDDATIKLFIYVGIALHKKKNLKT